MEWWLLWSLCVRVLLYLVFYSGRKRGESDKDIFIMANKQQQQKLKNEYKYSLKKPFYIVYL